MNSSDKNSFLCGIKWYKVLLSVILISGFGLVHSKVFLELSKLVTSIDSPESFRNQLIILIEFIILRTLLRFIGQTYSSRVKVELLNATDRYYFKRLYLTKPSQLQNYHTGVITSLMVQIKERKGVLYDILIEELFYAICQIIYIAYTLIRFKRDAGIVFLLSIALSVLINIILIRLNEKTRKNMIIATKEKNKVLMDFISGIMTVKKTRSYEFLRDYLRRGNRDVREKTIKSEMVRSVDKALKDLLSYITIIILIVMVYNTDSSNTELLIYLSTLSGSLSCGIQSISMTVFSYADYKSVKKQIFEVIESLDTIERTTEFNEYSLRDVKFKYDNNTTEISIDDFTVHKGDKIVITGESGQGKTTLLNILTGFIEPKQCIKLLDNTTTNKFIEGVIVTQDVELFDISLRDNLTLGKEISDETILSLISRVGLSDWYQRLENGLDTKIGEKGNKLSVGQKQRLSLLRGLLTDAEIYFFDEPTSNLDEASENKIIELFKEVLRDKTFIIITHRLALLELSTKHYKYQNNILTLSDN